MRLDFWYEFASTYSYPAAMRIEDLAQARGISLRWRPFLLGPIFVEQGWRNSPFNIFPQKGAYMWRDMARITAALGLEFHKPDPFPQNSLLAARTVLAVPETLRPAFSRAVYVAAFAQGQPIAERDILAQLLEKLGLHASTILEKALSEPIKARLKAENEEAKRLGIFGAPTFLTEDGEMFWGNDRLEAAINWERGAL